MGNIGGHSLQILGDNPGVGGHSLQILYDPLLVPNSLSVSAGVTISGTLTSIQTLDSVEFIVREVVSTPGLSFDFTFSGVHAANPKVIHFEAWYEGDPSHSVKLQIKNNNQTWGDVVGALFPNASSSRSYSWNLPVPITDYVYNTLLSLRVIQTQEGSASRKFHVDYVNVSDVVAGPSSGLNLSRSIGL